MAGPTARHRPLTTNDRLEPVRAGLAQRAGPRKEWRNALITCIPRRRGRSPGGPRRIPPLARRGEHPLHPRARARGARGAIDAQPASALELGGRRSRADRAREPAPRRLGLDAGRRSGPRHRPRPALAPRRPARPAEIWQTSRATGGRRSISWACSRARWRCACASASAPSDGSDGASCCSAWTTATRAVTIPFGGASGGRHTLVVGATGSGKTVTQTWIAVRAIERGMGAIVVDPKGDGGMREAICGAAAAAADGRFLEWTPDGGSRLQPLRARQRDRDRRQGARGRALHRAALPAPGAALPRPRRCARCARAGSR